MATPEELQKENEKLKLELQETKLCFKSFVEVHKQTELDKVKKKLKHANYMRCMAMSKYCFEESTRFHLFSNNSQKTSIYREIIHERDKWRKRSDKWLSLALAQKYK